MILLLTFLLLIPPLSHGQSVLQVLQGSTLTSTPSDTLALIFHPAPTPIDWSSPGAMARSGIWNTLLRKPFPISHVDVYLSCEGQKPILTGMSRTNTLGSVWYTLTGGDGMRMLTHAYQGQVVRAEQALAYTRGPIHEGKVRVLSFHISKKTCERLSDYWSEYQRRGYHQTYSGFTANPFRGEGAGCAAFAMSFLRVAGLLSDDLKSHWMRHLNIPERLFRSGDRAAATGFWGYMLLGLNEAWAGTNEPATRLDLFDPELMYNWTGQVAVGLKYFKGRTDIISNSIELTVDREDAEPPHDDYWKYSWP